MPSKEQQQLLSFSFSMILTARRTAGGVTSLPPPCHLATTLPGMAGVISVTTGCQVKCRMKAESERACLAGGAEIKLLEIDWCVLSVLSILDFGRILRYIRSKKLLTKRYYRKPPSPSYVKCNFSWIKSMRRSIYKNEDVYYVDSVIKTCLFILLSSEAVSCEQLIKLKVGASFALQPDKASSLTSDIWWSVH